MSISDMLVLPLVITLIFVIILIKKIVYSHRVDYECYLLTMKSADKRLKGFLNTYDHDIPLHIVYGDDTRTPDVAKKYIEFIDPIYYKFALKTFYDKSVIRPNITFFNMGAIGCYFGHMDIYNKCFSNNKKYALVFEDNVIITDKKLFDEVQSVIDQLGDDFELCFFHCLSRMPESEIDQNGLQKIKWISSTKCYLIHVDNMRNYHKHFYPMDNHVDMKHEDLISMGARVYYKDLRHCMKIDRSHKSIISHSEWNKKDFFSKRHPHASPSFLEKGY